MTPNQIRKSYLQYFKERGHEIIASSPVVPQGDDTLLFTNAGMNQFKDVFLGHESRHYARATSVQKCVRAGGKHNDLDEVGRDGRHLTFFEMLGNWSFGDYYKRDSIIWAWDFVTNVLQLDVSRLYITVYKDDDASYGFWVNTVGVAPDRVLRLGNIEATPPDEENFWSMGPTGPCGPCTEMHYDLHPELGPITFQEGAYDEDRIIEFWNLVFMEFDRDEHGTLSPLPMKSVDTGMGLDRMAYIKADKDNIFHTALFTPILLATAKLCGRDIEDITQIHNDVQFTDFGVIADHIRTVTFSLCDGAKFSNTGRGSVLRSILRRAVKHGRDLGFDAPFLHKLVSVVVEHYGSVYPEVRALGDQAATLIKLEEERFWRTIERGITLFEEAVSQAKKEHKTQLTGAQVFTLHATYGFPWDMTRVLAQDAGLDIDETQYRVLWEEHQKISKGKDMYADTAHVADWITLSKGDSNHFVGYKTLEFETTIRKIRERSDDGAFEVLLASTPFYAESGGQVGDIGTITSKDFTLDVLDTQKTPMGIVHHAHLSRGTLEKNQTDVNVIASVDAINRRLITCNHTATHLLHTALHTYISDEAKQAGSQVSASKLRFDFTHGVSIAPKDLRLLEDWVNAKIREGHDVVIHEHVPREKALSSMGAMALFGEKYGDTVRVVDIPGASSVELCGGTHVKNTREINLFRILSESSVSAGVRRIEAVTQESAYIAFQQDRDRLCEVAQMLKTPSSQIIERTHAWIDERASLTQKLGNLSQRLAHMEVDELVTQAIVIEDIKVLSRVISVDTREQMMAYADKLRDRLDKGIVLLGATLNGKAALICIVTKNIFKERKIKAGDLINKVATHVDGRGGGRPELAQAGGSKPEGVPAAIDAFEQVVREALGL